MLPPLESSRRERHFYRIARIRSEWDLVLAFSGQKLTYANEVGYLRAPSFGRQVKVTWPKGKPGHAFSSLGHPPFPEIGPPDTFSDRLCMRQKFPPTLKTSRRGTPRKVSPRGVKIATLSSCGGRAFSVHMPIFRAMIDRWRNSRAQGSVLKNSFKNPFM